MSLHELIYEKDHLAGDHIRIWRRQDGSFLFEHIACTGKSRSVACPTIEAALMLIPEEYGQTFLFS